MHSCGGAMGMTTVAVAIVVFSMLWLLMTLTAALLAQCTV